ncbi:MAG: carbon starvation protein [Streptococcaceae bacterium]|jgi:uncharacterized membrane protein|nr:carbon starvation protein [Streptococcaceae bacterium]
MNKELNPTQKSRLYGLTALVCAFWLGQSILKAVKSENLLSVYNVIFYISLILVISYTSFSAYQLWSENRNNSTKDS